MTNHTLAHITLPSMPPKKIFQPYAVAKNSRKPPYRLNIVSPMMSQPVMKVNIAPQRNHHKARPTRLPTIMPERTCGSAVAKNGVCTKLK